jgi:hypothetical protein
MTELRDFVSNLAFRTLGTPAAAGWVGAAMYTNWIQLAGVARRIALVPVVGPIAADCVIEVFEATDSSGTSAQELTGVVATSKTFANGTDEGRVGLIEVKDDDLSDGFTHVALKVTAAGNDMPFAAVAILADLYDFPASNATTDGVAFTAAS